MPPFLVPIAAWLARNVLYLALAALLLAGGATLRGCAVGGQNAQRDADNPTLNHQQVRALHAADRADSLAARRLARTDSSARVQADSARRAARTLTVHTNALHAQITRLPSSSPGPLARIARRLQNYQSPDTAR